MIRLTRSELSQSYWEALPVYRAWTVQRASIIAEEVISDARSDLGRLVGLRLLGEPASREDR